MLLRKLIILFLLFASLSSAAEELNQEDENNSDDEFSWQFTGHLSAIYNPTILKNVEQQNFGDYVAISLRLDLYYKGFFLESNRRRVEGGLNGSTLGYQLIVKDKWELDIITKNYVFGYEPGDIVDDHPDAAPIFEGLNDRDPGNGLALKYSQFIDEDIFSIDLVALAPNKDHNGWMIETFYSHLIPYRNWDIYLGGGLTFYSDKIVDYYVGIDPDEVNDFREEYQPSNGYRAQLEIFAQYPIYNSWTFNAGITQSFYSSSFGNSPLIGTQHTTQVLIGVAYVF